MEEFFGANHYVGEASQVSLNDDEIVSESAQKGKNPVSETLVVILPCKAHLFHQECIASWMKKQNQCPICRQEITLAALKDQKREINSLLKSEAPK